jgi:hypothetical protein
VNTSKFASPAGISAREKQAAYSIAEGREREGGSARRMNNESLTFLLALCQAVPLDMYVSVASPRLVLNVLGSLMCRSRTDCRLR